MGGAGLVGFSVRIFEGAGSFVGDSRFVERSSFRPLSVGVGDEGVI